jgi:hypothetical protein
MQHQNILTAYPPLLEKENFSRFIEFGTCFGGLPLVFREVFDFKGDIITYDCSGDGTITSSYMNHIKAQDDANHWPSTVDSSPSLSSYPAKTNWYSQLELNPPDIRSKFAKNNIDYRIKDVFNPEVMKEIGDLIQGEGKTLLMCDNGNKPGEINAYAKFLKEGDIILGHDYFKGECELDIWIYKDFGLGEVMGTVEERSLNIENEYTESFRQCATFIGVK